MTLLTMVMDGLKTVDLDLQLTKFHKEGGNAFIAKTHPLPISTVQGLWFFYDRPGNFDINWNITQATGRTFHRSKIKSFTAKPAAEFGFEFTIEIECEGSSPRDR